MKRQANIMEKQGLLMLGCWRKCWKALEAFKNNESTSNYYGKTMFNNAGMLAEMLESIEIIQNQLKYNQRLWKNKVY